MTSMRVKIEKYKINIYQECVYLSSNTYIEQATSSVKIKSSI